MNGSILYPVRFCSPEGLSPRFQAQEGTRFLAKSFSYSPVPWTSNAALC